MTIPDVMRAWRSDGYGHRALRLDEMPVPTPRLDEILVRVLACGVCRTDLHVADGDLSPHRSPVVPGHEIAGEVVSPRRTRRRPCPRGSRGDRLAQADLRRLSLVPAWCGEPVPGVALHVMGRGRRVRRARHSAGGARLPAPDDEPDIDLAPLLCAGIIGFRALRRANLPPGGRPGIYGFGASAHLTAQIALAQGDEVHVLTRGPAARRLALDLGATSAGAADHQPPVLLDSAILFAPAGELVPVALAALDMGGTLAVGGIHLSDIHRLDYQRHPFRERTLTSVTSNTRADGENLLRLTGRLGSATVTPYPFEGAADALADLADDRVSGVAVLVMGAGD